MDSTHPNPSPRIDLDSFKKKTISNTGSTLNNFQYWISFKQFPILDQL